MRYFLLVFLVILPVALAGCSEDEPGTIPPPPEPPGPASPGELMTSFLVAYENLDFDHYMSLLHPDFEMKLQQETVDQFPTVGLTLDYTDEQGIHERMFSGEDLEDPDTGAFIPGVESFNFRNFSPLDEWTVAKTDTTNPEGLLMCPYAVDIVIYRGQDQAAMRTEGLIRFYAVGIDTLFEGEMTTYYRMTRQVDLTGNFKDSEQTNWGSIKAVYR